MILFISISKTEGMDAFFSYIRPISQDLPSLSSFYRQNRKPELYVLLGVAGRISLLLRHRILKCIYLLFLILPVLSSSQHSCHFNPAVNTTFHTAHGAHENSELPHATSGDSSTGPSSLKNGLFPATWAV